MTGAQLMNSTTKVMDRPTTAAAIQTDQRAVKTRFDRRELKFELSSAQRSSLTPGLLDRLEPDPHGDAEGFYRVVSLYYDSPQLDAYYERLRSIKPRHKLRLRGYALGTDEEAVFVEIKTKLRRRAVKRRVALPMERALALCRGEPPEITVPPSVQLVIDDVLQMVRYRDLRPQMIVAYKRQAFSGQGPEANLRVTFDDAITFRRDNLEDLYANGSDGPVLPPDRALLEVKVDEAIPQWLSLLIAKNGGLLRSFSKYCRAVELSELPLLASNAPVFRSSASVKADSRCQPSTGSLIP